MFEYRDPSTATWRGKTVFGLAFLFLLLIARPDSGTGAGPNGPCRKTTPAWQAMTATQIALDTGRGRNITLTVRLADEPVEITAGYQFLCPDTIEHGGILFDFGAPATSRFHMQNVFIPLDASFFRADGILINTERMRPEPPGFQGRRTLYRAKASYRYVLETPAGLLSGQDLVPGKTRLVFPKTN